MTIRLKPGAKAILLAAVAATQLAPHRVNNALNEKGEQNPDFKQLADAGFILFQPAKDDPTAMDIILSDEGAKRAKSYAPPENPRAPAPDPSAFIIKKLDKAPEITRQRGGARTIYPFEQMSEVLMSFFVPATEARPKPWDTMRSTVGTHNKKLKEAAEAAKATNPNAPDPWVFDIYEDTENGAKGARIYRKA